MISIAACCAALSIVVREFFIQSCCINQFNSQRTNSAIGRDPVAGCAFDIGYNRFFPAAELIEQGAFAGVWRACEDYFAAENDKFGDLTCLDDFLCFNSDLFPVGFLASFFATAVRPESI